MSPPISPRAQLEALLKIINDAAQVAIAEYEKLGDAPSPLATELHPQDLREAPNLTLIRATRLLEGACDQLCATLSPPAQTLQERAQIYYWAAYKVAQEAQIPTLLEGRPNGVSTEELSEKTGIEKDNLTRILRTLSTRSLYIERSPGVFAHSRLSANLLSPFFLSDVANAHLRHVSLPATNLYTYLTDPKRCFTKLLKDSPWHIHNHEVDFFSYLDEDKARRETFGRAMTGNGQSQASLVAIFDFPWKETRTVADVGSGIGGMGGKLAQEYPHLSVILHDLPNVMSDARSHWAKTGNGLIESGRLKFTDYSFFDGPPTPGLDMYIYRNILADWPDETCVEILRQGRKAMREDSRLFIQEIVLHDPVSRTRSLLEMAPEPMLPNFGKGSVAKYSIDLTMLTLFNSKLRTWSELEALAIKANLKLVKCYDYIFHGVMVFEPV